MNYLPYGSLGDTPKWRWGAYVLVLVAIIGFLGHQFDTRLYWGIPIVTGLLILFFIGINWLVRDPERRLRLAPYAKWLILAAVVINIFLFFWDNFGDKGR